MIKGSNVPGTHGARVANGYLSLNRGAATAHGSNFGHGGDRRANGNGMAQSPCPVHPPNHAFSVGHSAMAQPPAPVSPGHGDIPVETTSKGLTTIPLRDASRKR